MDLSSAFLGVLGETVERILPIIYSKYYKEKVIYGSAKEMRKKGYSILGPEKLFLFAKEQYKDHFFFKPFTEDTWLGWIKGENLLTGEDIYAPAQLMTFGYKREKEEPPIAYSHSGGLTCHTDRIAGRYHGFTEFIERDQMNVRWVCKFPPREIIIDSIDEELEELFNKFYFLKILYVRTKFYHWSLDIPEVHVVTAHVVNITAKKMKYFPGMGSDISFKVALKKALAEVGQAEKIYYIAALSEEGELPPWLDISPNADHSEITDLFKTLAYYGFDKNLSIVENFYKGTDKILLSTLLKKEEKKEEEKYKRLLEIFKLKGLTPLCFDLTPPNFKFMKLQRCFIPELTMYFMVHGYYGHPRYYKLGVELGLTKKEFSFTDLNKSPLPFP
jgi:ribosomal protein S12 methylthiotransferase accessory factor